MALSRDDILPSDTLSDFINWIEEMKSLYNASYDEVGYEDAKIQDFLHGIEFAENAKERNKMARALQQSRKVRRESKDQSMLVELIVKFFEDKQNKDALNRMKNLLGKQRAQENYLLNERTYKNKVLDDE